MADLRTELGPFAMRTCLVAASGTVGSVADFAAVGALDAYGAAVAKSVSEEPWDGRPAPRLAPAGHGMLNGIGIQNPGIEAWLDAHAAELEGVGVPVWGSVVGHTSGEFGRVAKSMSTSPVMAIEVNLSCPNLDDGALFSIDADRSGSAVAAVRSATDLPVGAKLSPNAPDVVSVAAAVRDAGADWVVLTNTVFGFAIDTRTRRPVLSGGVGGYSGPPIKPIAMRCVWEVHRAMPDLPIVACGGVRGGDDVVEYLMAGANAVAIGTAHFAEPRVGRRVAKELAGWMRRNGVDSVRQIVDGAMQR